MNNYPHELVNEMRAFIPDTNGSDNSIPMAYLTLDHQLQVKHSLLFLRKELVAVTVFYLPSPTFHCPPSAFKSLSDMMLTSLISDPSTWEAEARGSGFRGQLQLQNKLEVILNHKRADLKIFLFLYFKVNWFMGREL